jgi:predicted nucleic acid-binding protein
MIEDGVIVDTSVLIAFFRGDAKIADKVSSLLRDNRVITTGIIIAELLQGMKDVKEEKDISDILAETSPLEITTALWIKAGKAALSLRRKGINLPLTDVAIGVLAIEHDIRIFTLDKHFERIPGVRMYK